MTKEELESILTLIATDDDLRAQIVSDPITALAPFGLQIDAAHAPPNVVVNLMPKQTILDQLGDLSEDMSHKACAGVFFHQIWVP